MAPPEPADPLDDLRASLRATRDAAQRLGQAGVPPQGWAVPPRPDGEAGPDDLAALLALVRALRDTVPAELERQLTDTIREILLLVRALIDRWLALLEQQRDGGGEAGAGGPEVQDIPIEG